jgi:hypothetical protein
MRIACGISGMRFAQVMPDRPDDLLAFQPMTRRHQPDFSGEMVSGQGLEPRSTERALWDEQEYVMQDRSSKPMFWQHAVRALAIGKLPDFSGGSEEVVMMAFNRLFSRNVGEELCEDVNAASEGRVRLELADIDLFSARVMGPAVYLRLTVDGQSRLLTFGLCGIPFNWDQGR